MNRLLLITTLWIALLLSGCDAESVTSGGENGPDPDTGAAVLVGGSGIDRGASVIATSDGGVLIAGTTNSDDGDFETRDGGNPDAFFLISNLAGEVQ